MTSITRIFDLLPHLKKKCRGKADMFAFPVKDEWIYYSVDDYIRWSGALCYSFSSLGYEPGDRVVTIMGNRPEWNFIDMGLMRAGLIHVPVYPTLSMNTIGQIINDCRPRMIIVESPGLSTEILQYVRQEGVETEIYSMHASSGIRHFNELAEAGLRHYDASTVHDTGHITPDTIATIIYTSGTTGKPKGVMLTHANIVSNFLAIAPISDFGPRHRAMSFLPLCHIYERTLNYMFQYLGLSIYYATPIERVGELIRFIRPHVFCAVPRFLEKVWFRFLEHGYKKHGIQRWLFQRAIQTAFLYELKKKHGIWYRIRLFIARNLVFRQWKKKMGGRIQIIVSGSASLPAYLARAYWAAGICLLEGYGLTETSPVIAVNRTGKNDHKIGTVGPPLESIRVKISEDGEILCKGPNVMHGYWQNPALTDEIIDKDGWLHTGDIGEWEEGRFLRIIDRKKELIKTSGGKYISPQQIETLFNESLYFDQTMVIGEGRNFPAAIISPDFKNLLSWCKNNNIACVTPNEMISNRDVVRMLYQETEKFNRKLGKFEMIKRFLFVTEAWDPQTGELSPTLKLRRKTLLEQYSKAIDNLYEDEDL